MAPVTPRSAGLMMYRRRSGRLEVLLGHPGGPFFRKKDRGVWSIPKGLIDGTDDPLTTAVREFEEETGIHPGGVVVNLGVVEQRGGKVVVAWAFQGERDESEPITSNTFEMEWPPRSGRMEAFPEIDRAAFFDLDTARRKINPAQAAFIDRLESAVR